MKIDNNKWEEAIRSKIIDYEADVSNDNWKAISGRLDAGKSVTIFLHRRFGYAAAAAIAILLISGGLYFRFYSGNTGNSENTEFAGNEKPVIAEVEVKDTPANDTPNDTYIANNESVKPNIVTKKDNPLMSAPVALSRTLSTNIQPINSSTSPLPSVPDLDDEIARMSEQLKSLGGKSGKPALADASREVKRSRWSIGMGGGSYTVGSSSPGLTYRTFSSPSSAPDSYQSDNKNITLRNSVTNISIAKAMQEDFEEPKGSVSHKLPISTGLGISYALNNRWALQSGLAYTLLRSEWNYHDPINSDVCWKQNMHFIGVPLELAFKIAEWKRLRFYASAGGMGELNFSGNITRYQESDDTEKRSSRKINEPLWSVNAHTGASYPLWKFLNLYAEAGVSYYFKYESSIETIRSHKPFNVSLQAGIRLGF